MFARFAPLLLGAALLWAGKGMTGETRLDTSADMHLIRATDCVAAACEP